MHSRQVLYTELHLQSYFVFITTDRVSLAVDFCFESVLNSQLKMSYGFYILLSQLWSQPVV